MSLRNRDSFYRLDADVYTYIVSLSSLHSLSRFPRGCFAELALIGEFSVLKRGSAIEAGVDSWQVVVCGAVLAMHSGNASERTEFRAGDVIRGGGWAELGAAGAGIPPHDFTDLVSADDETVVWGVKAADLERCAREAVAEQVARLGPKLRATGLLSDLAVARILSGRFWTGVMKELDLPPGARLFSAGDPVGSDSSLFLLLSGEATVIEPEPTRPPPARAGDPGTESAFRAEDQLLLNSLSSALALQPHFKAPPRTPPTTPRPALFLGTPIPSQIDPIPASAGDSALVSLSVLPIPQPQPRKATSPGPRVPRPAPRYQARSILAPSLLRFHGPFHKSSLTAKSACEILLLEFF